MLDWFAQRLLSAAGFAADAIDSRRADPAHQPGVFAAFWASIKMLAITVVSPIGVPAVSFRAMINHRRARHQMRAVAARIRELAATPPRESQADPLLRRLDARHPYVIISDQHRCVRGRLDLAEHQDTKALTAAMLGYYAERQYHLIENGDIEDYWMVGGSTWGVVYDVFRLATGAGIGGATLRRATYRAHLRRILANNAAVYHVIRSGFVAGDRFTRTVGNHDDVYDDPALRAALTEELGGGTVATWVTLDGPDGLEAVIIHGHQADGWNAPGRATLGRLSSWIADAVRDAPGPLTPDDLASPIGTRALLGGRVRNGLLRVHDRFGASSSYDSLDEEQLFDAVGGATPAGPWLIMGHTHFPTLSPASASGARWWRYANSGHGIGAGLVTAIEWPGDSERPDDQVAGTERAPRLVAWCWADHPAWSDLFADQSPTLIAAGRPVMRVELRPSPDGRRLEPSPISAPST